MLVGTLAAGCGPRFTPPAVSDAELQSARLLIAATPPALARARPPEDDTALLAGVAQRVAAAAQSLCTVYLNHPCEMEVTLDPSPTPRAAATGGGQVTVTAGMMRLLDSEDELAAILGHEAGHLLAGHLGRRWARGAAAGMAASALLGAVVPFGGVAAWALGQGAAELGAGAARLAFSKEEEREADYLSAYLIARAGYDLDRAGGVWAKLSRGPQETTGMLDSHPAGPDRLAAWQRTAEEIRISPDRMPRRWGQ